MMDFQYNTQEGMNMDNTIDRREFKKAMEIGMICIVSYLSSYFLRNILSVSTPQMVENKEFTNEMLGFISSLYFMTYAFGQLVNGNMGDKVKGKYMVTIGLSLAGISILVFPLVNILIIQIICFGICGFGLSMLRGPLIRIISENTLPKYARNCCVGFSATGFVGPLLAGMLAAVFPWKIVFYIAAFSSLLMAFLSYTVLTSFEKNGMIVQSVVSNENKVKKGGYIKLFRLKRFTMFMIIVGITEIAGAAIIFWIPTYISERLGFSSAASSVIYSIISVIKAFTPFICLFVFSKLRENDILLMKIMFLVSAVAFIVLLICPNVWLNLILVLLALMTVGCVSTVIWSIYIPSLRDSGCVSSANGFLDFCGYMITAVANVIFANALNIFGWNGLICIWSGIMFFGEFIVLSFNMYYSKKERNA